MNFMEKPPLSDDGAHQFINGVFQIVENCRNFPLPLPPHTEKFFTALLMVLDDFKLSREAKEYLVEKTLQHIEKTKEYNPCRLLLESLMPSVSLIQKTEIWEHARKYGTSKDVERVLLTQRYTEKSGPPFYPSDVTRKSLVTP